MKRLALTLLFCAAQILLAASAEENTAYYTPTGAFTNSAGKVYYLGTTNVAAAATIDLITAGSTQFIVPDGIHFVDIHWSAKASGTTGTNVLYMATGILNPATGVVDYDTGTNTVSQISLTMPWKAESNTNMVSAQFSVQGRKYLKPGSIVSTTGSGTSTNHLLYIGYRTSIK